MRLYGLAILAVVILVLQLSLLPALRPFGVVPNIALVFIALVGVEVTAGTALILAVACGVVLDVASPTDFGLWMGMLLLVALAVGLVKRVGLELGGLVSALGLVVVGTVLMHVVIVASLAEQVEIWQPGVITSRLVGELLLNAGLVVVLRPVIRLVAGARDPRDVIV